MTSDVDIIEQEHLTADNPCNQSIEITTVADARRNSRVDEYILAEAIAESGEMVTGIIVDISFSGFRLEGGRLMIETLLPYSNLKGKHRPTPVRVDFIAPGNSAHSISTKIRCNIVSSRKFEDTLYQVNMEFIEFETGTTELAEYLISRGLT